MITSKKKKRSEQPRAVCIDPVTHRLLKKWCKKTGMKMGPLASKLIHDGIKNEGLWAEKD